jgi:hypothetical protein
MGPCLDCGKYVSTVSDHQRGCPRGVTATVISAVPRQQPVTAMRVLMGITTKAEILRFCPRANVGVGVASATQNDLYSTDIRWVLVPHNGEIWEALNSDGGWNVQKALGHFFIYTDTEFHREYVMA